MKKFGEAPLSRVELEDHCRSALAAAEHVFAELAEDLNEATDTELIDRVFLARRVITPGLPMLLPREPHRPKAALAFWTGVPKPKVEEQSRGVGSFLAWLFGFRTVTRADITPRSA